MPEDGLFRWWEEEPDMGDMPEGDEASTRPADHPDGFSFLLAHPDPFWRTWLAFSALEIERLRFLRWRYLSGQLSESLATEKLAA